MTMIARGEIINNRSVVIIEPDETKCDNRIVAWYYLKQDGRMCFRPQAPGVEARIKNAGEIVAVWPWDGSWSNWWQMLIEAWALGVGSRQLRQLAEARGCDNRNAVLFGKNFGITLYEENLRYVATVKNVTAKSKSYLEAMGKLCVKLGYVGHPETTLHFLDLIK